jgi:hypothetical protein
MNFGLNFQTRYDEYVVAQFRTEHECGIDNVRPEAGGFGVRPITVARRDDGSWRAGFKLPPGLTPGWHDVTVRVGNSAPSNARRIAVDFPAAGPAHIEGASDGATWKPNELSLSRGNVLSVWVTGLPENADDVSTRALLGGEPVRVLYIEPAAEAGTRPRQMNVHIPDDAPLLELELEVNRSSPVSIRILP